MRILLLWDRSVTQNPEVIHFLFGVVALYRKIENSLLRTWFVFVTLTPRCLEPEVTLSDDTGMTCKFCFVRKAWLIIWHYSASNLCRTRGKKFFLRRLRRHATRQRILAKISNIEFHENRFSGFSSCFKEKQTGVKILHVISHIQLILTTLPWMKSIILSTIPGPWLYKLWHFWDPFRAYRCIQLYSWRWSL
jgi:hypothetical protein